jgi:hypothetical protein
MAGDQSIQSDYQNGVSSEAAANAGTQAGQNGQPCAPQQPNESAEAFAQRQAAYEQAKNAASSQS